MVFSSSLFLLFFLPVFLSLYYLTPARYKNYTALAASVFFYAWGAPKFIFLVVGSLILDFYLTDLLHRSAGSRKKLLLSVTVLSNVAMLLFFKYANFFFENVNSAFNAFGHTQISWVAVALPIGISFFTFQKLSYTIDVFRGVHRPLDKFSDYVLYILLFPQLIAGPIIRFNEIADQIEDNKRKQTSDDVLYGFYRFIIGLSKKVLIANTLGAEVDLIFSLNQNSLSTSLAWVGIIAYSFQIYYDFSGYSDMALGIGRMIGFKFPENFNNPYISQSITEFWRRWHITLGRWMRDYLYIPLGGNRVNSTFRLYLNLWIVFLFSGLWHGADWTFLIWGAYHGLFLIADRAFLLKLTGPIGVVPRVLLTYVITLVGWVFFRSPDLKSALAYIGKMFSWQTTEGHYHLNPDFLTMLAIGAFFAFITLTGFGQKMEQQAFAPRFGNKALIAASFFSAVLFVFCLSSITTSGFNPFIYFRF